PLPNLPPILIQSVIYTQDPTFWSHPGFTVKGLIDPQKHPTLAQQLVADLLLFQEPPTLRRAIRERLLAYQITQRFGRDRILEWYLNSADFGQNVIGLASAAEIYLGKQPADLSSAEALLLASILQNPQITPHSLPEEARRRAHLLAQSLLQAGKLTPEEAQSIEQELLSLPFPPPPNENTTAFLRLVLDEVQSTIPLSRLKKGGLTLYTTLDKDLQQRANCLLQLFAVRIAAQPEPSRCPEATPLPTLPPAAHLSAPSLSAIILDVPSGEILAAIGESYQGQEFPLWSPHPAGSILDPFVYLTAFTRGWSPASLVWDLPAEGESATSFLGPMRMRRALANGLPTVTQKLRHELGEAAIQRTFSLLGIQEDRVTLPQL
ncbi:MAG: transglycosylase domain-containing protein, partial [Anaerolineales bacterium]